MEEVINRMLTQQSYILITPLTRNIVSSIVDYMVWAPPFLVIVVNISIILLKSVACNLLVLVSLSVVEVLHFILVCSLEKKKTFISPAQLLASFTQYHQYWIGPDT